MTEPAESAALNAILPDVPGADSGCDGLPTWNELTPRDRAVVRASAAADIALRTAVASTMLVTAAPTWLAGAHLAHDRENLPFYAELGQTQDASAVFPAPTRRPKIVRRRANVVTRSLTQGTVDQLSFDSPFAAVNPAVRDSWAKHARNQRAYAQHWRHEDGPRPTICVIHGFIASPYWFNGLFLQLPWFYKAGFDVLLYTMPFHGERAARWSPFSGHGFFAHGVTGICESMAHAVHDFRVFLTYLQDRGVEDIAVTGISLGGYTSALLAAIDDRIDVVMPNVPVTNIPELVNRWSPVAELLSVGRHLGLVDTEALDAAFAMHSPLNYQPIVPKQARLIITGLGDRLAPPSQAQALWRHWDEPSMYWFPGNHLVHVSQPNYLRRMTHFLRDNDFAPPEWR